MASQKTIEYLPRISNPHLGRLRFSIRKGSLSIPTKEASVKSRKRSAFCRCPGEMRTPGRKLELRNELAEETAKEASHPLPSNEMGDKF